MNWTTLYITGRADFRGDVLKKLEGSKLEFMPGYLGRSSEDGFHDLYWISDAHSMREIKEAVGSKLIWKYRLRFFRELEEFLQEITPVKSDEDDLFELPEELRRSA